MLSQRFLPTITLGVALLLAGCSTPPTASLTATQPSSSASAEIYDLKALDVQPVQKNQLRANYPAKMKKKGITGEAVVEFIVDTSGMPRDVHAVRATNRYFAATAIEAVQQLRFRPGRKNGRPVNIRLQQPISFSISD